jgi:hypothetical protein
MFKIMLMGFGMLQTVHAANTTSVKNDCQQFADNVYNQIDNQGTRDHRSSGVMPDTNKKVDGKKSITYSTSSKSVSIVEVPGKERVISQIVYHQSSRSMIKYEFADDCSISKITFADTNGNKPNVTAINGPYCEVVVPFVQKYAYADANGKAPSGDHPDLKSIYDVAKKYKFKNFTGNSKTDWGVMISNAEGCNDYWKYFSNTSLASSNPPVVEQDKITTKAK